MEYQSLRSTGIALSAMFGLCLAHSAAAYELAIPASTVTDQAIAPGGEGAIEFDVQFGEFDVDQATLFGSYRSHADAFAEYEFVTEDPAICLPPHIEPYFSSRHIVFPENKPQGTLLAQCRYRVLRAASSRHDLRFHICPQSDYLGFCEPAFRMGSLPDLTLHTRPVGITRPGDMSAVVEIVVRNHAARDVASRPVTTGCAGFAGGFGETAFAIDTDFPGACEENGGVGCINIGGYNFTSHGFDFGPVPAGGSASCLVRLQMREPITEATAVAIHFLSDYVPFTNGDTGFDPTDPVVRLGVAPTAAPLVVPFSPSTAWALVVLLIALGCARLRRD